jgi:L-iditol 2-dehydrogenase
MSFDEGMLVEPFAIGLYATTLAPDIKDKDCAVLGFGPIGMSVFQSLKMQGAKSISVTEKLDYRGKMALQQGADAYLNADSDTLIEEAHNICPSGYDLAFECSGSQEAANQAIKLLKPGGMLLIIGIPSFDTWGFRADEMRRKEITIRNVRRQNHCEEKAIDAIANKKVDLSSMITHRYPFESAGEAYKVVANYMDGVMKAVLHF